MRNYWSTTWIYQHSQVNFSCLFLSKLFCQVNSNLIWSTQLILQQMPPRVITNIHENFYRFVSLVSFSFFNASGVFSWKKVFKRQKKGLKNTPKTCTKIKPVKNILLMGGLLKMAKLERYSTNVNQGWSWHINSQTGNIRRPFYFECIARCI